MESVAVSKGTLVDALGRVAAFRPYTFRRQEVPRAAALLHPPFAILGAGLTSRVAHLRHNRFTMEGPVPPRRRPVIYIANHSSYLDPPVVGAAITLYSGRNPWFMAKKELWDEKLFYRYSFAIAGAIPFDRHPKDAAVYQQNLRPFASLLHAGESVVVFPEGRIPGDVRGEGAVESFFRLRSHVERKTGLLTFGPLAAELAAATGALIVPVGVSGTSSAKPPEINRFNILPKRPRHEWRIQVRFGEPIDISPDLAAQKQPLSGSYYFRFSQRTLAPALASLIDFTRHEVPIEALPLTDPDYEKMRAHETRIASLYEMAGQAALATRIRRLLAGLTSGTE